MKKKNIPNLNLALLESNHEADKSESLLSDDETPMRQYFQSEII